MGRLTILPDSKGEQDWRKDANCKGRDRNIFFPNYIPGASSRNTAMAARAKAICHACDVETDCLEYAMLNDLKAGIWGGHDERERDKLRKARNGLR